MEVHGIDHIWSAKLIVMQVFSRCNKGVKHLLTVIDVFSKYAWCMPLKSKTERAIVDAFDDILKQSGRKPRRLWVDRGCEFCNRLMNRWLKANDVMRYTYNEGKAQVNERFHCKRWSKVHQCCRQTAARVQHPTQQHENDPSRIQ